MRSNEEWVAALRDDGSRAQQQALIELSHFLCSVVNTYLWKREITVEREALAQDLAQDALLQIYQKLDQYSGKSPFQHWAATIATRTAGQELRKKRWQEVELPDYSRPDYLGVSPSVEAGVVEQQVLTRALETALSQQQRRAFLARFVDGYTNDEIAAGLGITRKAAYQLIYEARRKLRDELVGVGS